MRIFGSVLLLAAVVVAASPPGSPDIVSAGTVASRAGVSWILVDVETGSVVKSNWKEVDQPIPLGSLVKPFAALAYGQGHSLIYPQFECSGTASRCWLPAGHGRVHIKGALAQSCNAYFRRLSDQVEFDDLAGVTSRFGLPAPARGATTDTYFGFGDGWKIRPKEIVGAYGELIRRREEPGVREIVAGLALAAREGTAAGAGRGRTQRTALAKTGTAPCMHSGWLVGLRPSNGDGYVIVLYPADRPRHTLLLQAHGLTGRQAADIAGELLERPSHD